MRELVAKIEAADAFILASPTNVYAVTALFKRFMERLVVYAYGPGERPASKREEPRDEESADHHVVGGAGVIGRLFFGSVKGSGHGDADRREAGARRVSVLRPKAPMLGLARVMRVASSGRWRRWYERSLFPRSVPPPPCGMDNCWHCGGRRRMVGRSRSVAHGGGSDKLI